MRETLMLMTVLVASCGDGGSTKPRDATTDSDGPAIDAPVSTGPVAVYVASTGGDEIKRYTLDGAALTLSAEGSTPTGDGPSFLAFDPQKRFLVTVNELGNEVESFTIASDGALTRVDAQDAVGDGPTHLTIDHTGAWVLVAAYGSGMVRVVPIASDGQLAPSVTTVNPGANAHQVVLNAANTVAYVPCLGANLVAVYDFDASTGSLAPRTPVASAPGAGPRHIALHPNGTRAFVIDELASTITTYTVEPDGDLVRGASVSTLPANFNGQNTGAEIAVHPSGDYVYASNRGHDSIVRFRYSDGAGLTDPQHVSTFGAQPRHFSLLSGGTALLVAKQGSGGIHAFRVRAADGVLTPVGEVATASSPQFVGALGLD